jgi:hypothetical protein
LQARVEIPDRGWAVYRVVILEEGSDWLSLSKEISDVVESRIHVYLSKRNGKPVYVFDKDDRLKDGDRVLWTFILDTEQLGLMRLEKKVTSRSGKVVCETWYDFRDPMYDFPKNICYMYTIPIWLMGKDLEEDARYKFDLLLSPDGKPIQMYAEVKGVETVTVPAGKFETFHIVLEPDLEKIMGRWSWAKPLISPFIPDYDFWVEKAAPHAQVRYEGRFGPVGASPIQAYELIEIRMEEGE